MKPIIFNFETSNGVELQVWLEVSASGSYEEPELELDGDALVELIHTPELSEFIIERLAYTDNTTPIPTFYPRIERVNPAWRSSRINIKDLSQADQARLEHEIDSQLSRYLEEHWSDISQSIAERAADALHDAWKDGDI